MNGNYRLGLPIQASTIAGSIDFGIYLIHGFMFLIFILWGIFFTYLLFKYRRKSGVAAEHREGGVLYSLLPDFVVLLFEIALIVFYAIPVWSRIKIKMPKPEESNTIEIIAEQFSWLIHYPGKDGKFGRKSPSLVHANNPAGLDDRDPAAKDDLLSFNELHLPVNKPTLVYLTSKDVIHSFFVPEFRIKQDAVPGMRIPMWFEPNRIGAYEIVCAQLCGTGHSIMKGTAQVHSGEDFESWLASQTPALGAL